MSEPLGPETTPPSAPSRARTRVVVAAIAGAAVIIGVVAAVAATSSSSKHSGSASAAANSTVPATDRNGHPIAGATTTLPGASGSSVSTTVPGTHADGSSTPGATVAPGTTSGSQTPTSRPRSATPGGGPATTKPGATNPETTTTGDVPPAITQAYVQGFQAECLALWSQAGPSGKLWDADSLDDPPHTVQDCLKELDPGDAWFYFQDSPSDARAGGKSDADSAAEDMTLGNRFQNSGGLIIYIP